MKKMLLFSFVCLLMSCSNNIDAKYDILIKKLPKTLVLTGEKMQVPPVLYDPVRMLTVDTFLIVLQDKKQDSIFSIFSIPNCRLIGAVGGNGKGPHEFMYTSRNMFLNYFSDDGNNGFAIENKGKTIQFYKPIDLISGNLQPAKISTISSSLSTFRSGLYLSDSVIYGCSYGSDANIIKINLNNGKSTDYQQYPVDYPSMDKHSKREIFGNFMSVCPDNKKFVVAYVKEGKIEIFDINSHSSTIIRYKNFPSLENNLHLNALISGIKDIKKPDIFCWDVKSTKKYIYAEILCAPYKEVVKKGELNKDFIHEIHVFDWLGNLIRIVKPDSFFSLYDVDENDEFLYTIDSDFESSIMKYPLNNIVN